MIDEEDLSPENGDLTLVYPVAPASRPSVSELARRFDRPGRDAVKRVTSPRAEDKMPSSPTSPVVCSMHEFLASQRLREEELRRRSMNDRIRLRQNAHAIALAQAHERAIEFVLHEKLQVKSPSVVSPTNDKACSKRASAAPPNDACQHRGEKKFFLGSPHGTTQKTTAESIDMARPNPRDGQEKSNEAGRILPQVSLDSHYSTSRRQYDCNEDKVSRAPRGLQLAFGHRAVVSVVFMLAVLLLGILKKQGTLDSLCTLSIKSARELAVFAGSVGFEATYSGPEKHIVDLGCPWPIG